MSIGGQYVLFKHANIVLFLAYLLYKRGTIRLFYKLKLNDKTTQNISSFHSQDDT